MAAIRYELQAELFGLTNQQRQQAINFVENAVQGERVSVVGEYVNRVQTIRGEVEYVAEISFTSSAAGGRIFDQLYNWARTRAEDSPSGRQSYLWFKEVDRDNLQMRVRRAESPGWESTDVLEPLPAVL